ncbi:MAG: selenocysteine-specific translation elongation factor [Chloroflexi bacterium]|nr:selenocysteine-specific translation elongation factor [Chloroflexota bacterium]
MGGPALRVVGTAGHVDHGKSTLIQALTGIDPDRLQEEKDRGMTIDLGFAWLTLPSGREVSIVDVPGHERFIKNMLAGIGGIDIALLVVAADEGVMPQTREHLAILDLLGVRAGVVAITKRDLVDADWLDLVTAEMEEVLAPTSLAGVRLVPVSAVTGEGLEELAGELDRLLEYERQRRQTGWPRLPIDRVFTMPGFGTVVTGTLIDGELRVGQEIELSPSGRKGRIRGLQSHRQRIDPAPSGTRVAVNLVGLAVEDIDRGEVLTLPGWLAPTRAVDVRLRIVADAPRALPHNAQVTFHTGSAEALGRVALLDQNVIEPGGDGWAQIRLDRSLAVVRGDPFVVRSPAANLTVGGGVVIDDHPKRHRRFQERIGSQLRVLEQGSPAEQLVQTLQAHEPVDLRALAMRLGKTPEEAESLVATALANGEVIDLGNRLLISAAGWQRIGARVRAELEDHHAQHPLAPGMSREELRARLGLEARVFPRVERRLLDVAGVAEQGPFLRLAEHEVVLSPEQEASAAAVEEALLVAGVSPPSRSELSSALGVSPDLIQALIDRGTLVEVSADLVYAAETYRDIEERIRALILAEGRTTVARIRDQLATSRKFALAILEHLDQIKVTRRIGDERVLTSGPLSPRRETNQEPLPLDGGG